MKSRTLISSCHGPETKPRHASVVRSGSLPGASALRGFAAMVISTPCGWPVGRSVLVARLGRPTTPDGIDQPPGADGAKVPNCWELDHGRLQGCSVFRPAVRDRGIRPVLGLLEGCLLYTSPSPRDRTR